MAEKVVDEEVKKLAGWLDRWERKEEKNTQCRREVSELVLGDGILLLSPSPPPSSPLAPFFLSSA